MISNDIKKICENIKKSGGNCFFVGGYVRDQYLGLENKDIDIEVFNITYENLKKILSNYELKEYKKFGVFDLGFATFSLPRTEKKNGKNHYAFDVEINPLLTIEQAAKRRDFTINAIYQNVLSKQIIDPFGGIKDIEQKKIRHITENFIEDDLRIMRAIRFCSVYNLDVDEKTLELLKLMNFSNISENRIKSELEKMKHAKHKEKGNKIIKELEIDEKIRI